ncbi:addiction module toxin RelE [Candidatus Woesearchaeota archaeon]|nr:addiction module toxin RelE [Candidatus Woesearchaeota archaeon]
MRSYSLSENLQKILQKLSKKDRLLYDRVLSKIHEIISCDEVEHYKNLRHSMKNLKRVHIGHLVLVFEYDRSNQKIIFEDLDHHDNIYIHQV